MENLSDGKLPLPPPRKYVSIFCIDGKPILPPLMTSEKRRQMQKFKENALKIEQRIRERKNCEHVEIELKSEDMMSVTSHSSQPIKAVNQSQLSQDSYESKIKETEESMKLLQNLIKRQQGGNDIKPIESVNAECNTSLEDKNQEKLQKLQKSEILIYDNSTNEVIQLPAHKDIEKQESQIRDIENKVSLNFELPKKPSHLLLAGVNAKGMTNIPAICLNPPTPLMVNRNICDTISGEESSESIIISENRNKSVDDLSSDESFNSMITQTDRRSIRNKTKHVASKAQRSASVERKSLTPSKNVSAKIQQFEAISSESITPQTSPEKSYKQRKTCLGLSAASMMNRSATSPSIKLNTSNRSSSSTTKSFAQDSDNSPENNLVRSSSFTLEGPSKALIDHMQLQQQQQQQKAISDNKSSNKSPLNPSRSIARKPVSTPLRAHRDTVESKAKKVQKVELKSSKLKMQQKTSQSKLAQAATVSISPNNTSALTHHTNSLCKTKKSPYDISKTSHSSLQTLQKSLNTQMRKSNSTSSNLAQSKILKSQPSSATTHNPTSVLHNGLKTSQTVTESFSQMEKTQKEKFRRLLAQQEEEHRRLQESFEMQQKMLIEQLNKEMAASQHIKSLKNSYNSSTATSVPTNYKRLERQPLSPRPKSQLNLTGLLSDTSSQKSNTLSNDTKQKNSHISPSLSNNSSYISFAKHSSQTANFHDSSYGLQFNHSNNSHNNSQLSSMDHSNANTSFDISMLSNPTSPDTICATPTTQPNSAKLSSSSSRRRLFATEINDVRNDGNDLISRSNITSPYSVGQQPSPHGQTNKNPRTITNNDSNKCSLADNTLYLHAAATKINAYARGFLVRRLFQTEQIQRIVQTIRDTLIFVLNLHLETMENPEEYQTPANIKLKARVLQQLSSACRTLHLIFFQTSVKERMEIISRDRKRIKAKLLSTNHRRTPRIAG